MQDFFLGSINSDLKLRNDPAWNTITNNSFIIYYKTDQYKIFKRQNTQILIIGDYWNLPNFENPSVNIFDFELIIKTVKGSYYFFIITEDTIKIFTGFLSLCPVFYSKEYYFASSSFSLICNQSYQYEISERYILESFLFNHSLFNATIYKQVSLLSAHSVLQISESSIIEEQFLDTSKLIVDKPLSGKHIYSDLVSCFIETINDYMPQEGSAVTFTGGFDGRTIVSTGLYLNKNFTTFSFGNKNNDDVYIPEQNAMDLGLTYTHLDAENPEYINKYYNDNSREITFESGGFNGYLYPHFLYMAKEIKKQSVYLITGYGGSELMRGPHIMGAVTSKALYQIITNDSKKELKKALLSNESLRLLTNQLIDNNIDGLIYDLMLYKKKLTHLNTLNKKLYSYILNETLRKIFGVWHFTQSRYIKVRTPYLDYNFIEKLYKTDLAGIYNDFFTENPVKRFKGQLLYALIIKETNKIISDQKTGKGYKPNDLLSQRGKLKIIYPFLKKRIFRKLSSPNMDNLGLISGFKKNMSKHCSDPTSQYFNLKEIESLSQKLNSYTPERERDFLLNYYSIYSFIKYAKKGNSTHRL